MVVGKPFSSRRAFLKGSVALAGAGVADAAKSQESVPDSQGGPRGTGLPSEGPGKAESEPLTARDDSHQVPRAGSDLMLDVLRLRVFNTLRQCPDRRSADFRSHVAIIRTPTVRMPRLYLDVLSLKQVDAVAS